MPSDKTRGSAPHPAGARGPRPAGFTLIETLIVLVILGLIAGLVIARGPSRSPGFLLRSEAQVLVARLGEARGRAIALDRDVDVSLSRSPPGLAISGRPLVPLPRTLSLAMLTADGGIDPLARHLVFHPDGSADGGGVLLAGSAGRIAISVAWLTGRISTRTLPGDAT